MPNPEEEALLERTKMSFGEHLEELRRALFKSLIAITIGFVVGLCVSMPLVDYIQGPLREALKEHYLREAKEEQLRWLQEMKDAGQDVPANLELAAEKMAAEGLVPHDWYVSPQDLAQALKGRFPDAAEQLGRAQPGDAETAVDRSALIRLRMYQPVESDARLRTISLNSQEPFMVFIKAGFAAGLVLACPFVFYFIWEFIAAGLYRHEKRYIHIYLPISLALFAVGAAVAYFLALDYVLEFLFWFHEKMNIDPYPRLSDWVMTVVLLPLGFGVSFQLPLAMLLLERIGVFTVESYTGKWRTAVVVIAVLSMVLTPGGDPNSMMLMFIPLTALYFAGILMAKYMPGASAAPRTGLPAKPEHGAGS
jgi:sec-independent protein translocase protein TatC